MDEIEARDMAVKVVDDCAGYTIEFSADPVFHAWLYDEAEQFILRQNPSEAMVAEMVTTMLLLPKALGSR